MHGVLAENTNGPSHHFGGPAPALRLPMWSKLILVTTCHNSLKTKLFELDQTLRVDKWSKLPGDFVEVAIVLLPCAKLFRHFLPKKWGKAKACPPRKTPRTRRVPWEIPSSPCLPSCSGAAHGTGLDRKLGSATNPNYGNHINAFLAS